MTQTEIFFVHSIIKHLERTDGCFYYAQLTKETSLNPYNAELFLIRIAAENGDLILHSLMET